MIETDVPILSDNGYKVMGGWRVGQPPDEATTRSGLLVPTGTKDGNDALAVYAVVKKARDRAKKDGATLIEAITYRIGFHTSSDNPDLYRKQSECDLWAEWDPIKRMRLYLENAGWWSDTDEADLNKRLAAEIQEAVDRAEKMAIPGPESQFDDLYAESNWMLDEQRRQILSDLAEGAE